MGFVLPSWIACHYRENKACRPQTISADLLKTAPTVVESFMARGVDAIDMIRLAHLAKSCPQASKPLYAEPANGAACCSPWPGFRHPCQNDGALSQNEDCCIPCFAVANASFNVYTF